MQAVDGEPPPSVAQRFRGSAHHMRAVNHALLIAKLFPTGTVSLQIKYAPLHARRYNDFIALTIFDALSRQAKTRYGNRDGLAAG